MHRPAQKRLDQRIVPFEAAGAEHDAGPGADANILAAVVDSHPDDGAVGGDQFQRPGLRVRSHAQIEQALQQPGDQRSTRHAVVTGLTVHGGVDPCPRLGVDADVAEVGGKRRDACLSIRRAGPGRTVWRSASGRRSVAHPAVRACNPGSPRRSRTAARCAAPRSRASSGRCARTSRRVRDPSRRATVPRDSEAHRPRVSSPSGDRRCAGIHTMPPETAVVPPTVAAFSYTATDAPSAAAARAAVRPAPPLPSTTTSTSLSQSVTVAHPFG